MSENFQPAAPLRRFVADGSASPRVTLKLPGSVFGNVTRTLTAATSM